MAVKIGVESGGDGSLVVAHHPPHLFELPFSPGDRFGEVASEGLVEGRMSFL